MSMKSRTLPFILFCFLVSPAAVNRDPDSILNKNKASFEKLKMAVDFVSELENLSQHVAPELGLTGSLASFLSTLSNEGYTVELQKIMEIPVQKWNATAGWGRYDIEYVKRTVTQYQHVDSYKTMSNKIGKACKCLAAISIVNDCIKGFQGDDQAKLSAIGNAARWAQGNLVSDFGGKNLNIAMAGVAVIDYALSTFINFAFSSHQEFWWKGYVAYMENTYANPLEWAQLAEREGMPAVERRLQEFWDNAEMNASIHYMNGKRLPPHWGNVTGALLEKFKREFAATYYKDNIHTTMKTFFKTRADIAKDELEDTFSQLAGELSNMVKDLEMLKDVLENMPNDLDDPENQDDVKVSSLMDRLQSIFDQVFALCRDKQQGIMAEMNQCNQNVTGAKQQLTAIRLEAAAWKNEVTQQSSTGPDLTQLLNELKAQGDKVARAKDEAGQNSLNACEETLNLKWNLSAAEKKSKLPGIRASARRAVSEAQLARTTWASMKAKLDSVSGLDQSLLELENKRKALLDKIPNVSACEGVLHKGRSILATMESSLQTLVTLERSADSIVTQVQTILDSETADTGERLKQTLARMKNKATWLLYKKKLASQQAGIKAQVQAYTAKVNEIRSELGSTEALLATVQSLDQEARQMLGTPLSGSGNQDTYMDLKSWVDSAEMFVIPAKGAADQAVLCQQEAESLQPDDPQSGSAQGSSQNQGTGNNTGGSGTSSTGTSSTSTTSSGSGNSWDNAANRSNGSWDRAAQSGSDTSSSTGTTQPDTTRVTSGDADQWIQSAKNEANPPRCNFNLALQYLSRARSANPQHPELTSLEARFMKLQNDQQVASTHLARANAFWQAGQLDSALQEAHAASTRGTWCERNTAQDLISQIENQKTRTSVIAKRQRDADAAKSLISSLTKIQNTLIEGNNPKPIPPIGGSGTSSGNTGSTTNTSLERYCSITISSTPGGQFWALFEHHPQTSQNNITNYFLFQIRRDEDDPDSMDLEGMTQQLSQSMGVHGNIGYLGKGTKSELLNHARKLCPNPVSARPH